MCIGDIWRHTISFENVFSPIHVLLYRRFSTVNTPGGNPWRILSVKFHAMMYVQKMSGTVTNSIIWTHFVKCCWKIIGLVGNIIEWINFIHNNFIPSAWKNVLTPKQMVMTSKDHLKIWMLLTAQFSGKKLLSSRRIYICVKFSMAFLWNMTCLIWGGGVITAQSVGRLMRIFCPIPLNCTQGINDLKFAQNILQ